MNKLIFFVCILLIGCISKPKGSDNAEVENPAQDSFKYKIQDLGQIEKDLYDYYMETEKYLKDKHGISDDEINSYMQLLINEGTIDQPYIIINKGKELDYKALTYEEYKRYVNDIHVDSTKQLKLDYN